jgi:general secretion pathway protein J
MIRGRSRGFTLIEIVIAVAITGLMFVIGYAGINQALKDRDSLEAAQARLTALQRAMRVMSQDFAQVAPRPARDLDGGGEIQPAITSSRTNNILVTFTRSGWSNPAGAQRSAQQRVRYVFENGTLVRENWLSVDPALNAVPQRRVLLEKLTSATIRFMDPVSRTWREDWPPTPVGGGTIAPGIADETLRPRPVAIQITIDSPDWGIVSRMFEVST